jgi:AraC-like DNA-binding protein
MRVKYSTAEADPSARKSYWNHAVSNTYFRLDTQFGTSADFSGDLDVWSLGDVSISRLVSDGLLIRRHERHLLNEREESYIIAVPESADISFSQDHRDVHCRPGTFLVERSHLPYEFSYSEPNALWALKIPSKLLRARIGAPERFAALCFDSTRGVGALFVDMIRLAAPRLDEMDEAARNLTGNHLVDLLAMSIEADGRVLGGGASSVQTAHLQRAERFIRTNLAATDLSPQTIAEGCGISVRYLHQLFSTQGTTVGVYVSHQRLARCDEALRNPACRKSIYEIAYQWGFGDQAQFSRQYKLHFGCTPSDAREAALSATLPRPGRRR